ncbi:PKD domain-containing protein [Peribacillus muralis]|uniref:endo-beta-N-acetylglucosaminidase n=1 Tax=Peribacillus muralis TaxID=264697 RepID=UPI001F4E3973|nr:discoidin domain-containing protein [Peribacillus muralis]MCK1994920.1 discoidin domain-containing protein [Peribacillus muralis]MCK2015534.1 discoidin domain-containing protein [Peribacillus muralis]
MDKIILLTGDGDLLKIRYGLIVAFLGLLLVCVLPAAGFAKQPESSYWFPETLLKWSPENDSDAVYNKSTVPLADREIVFNVNETSQAEAKLVALSALNPNTSGVPSQGGNEFFANTFSYWQYVDLMVYWAGSAGEGIITPPSADVIDASHKNGVPILGTIFFPPIAYGGQEKWVDQMLTQREDGSFPAADKLLEVAKYYGFDGWFINQETAGGNNETAQKTKEFLKYLQDNKQEDMHIMWYDSMVENGSINWQNHLTDRNKMFLQDGHDRISDSMFLNFWWTNQQASHDKALEIGRSPYDLYTGIDVEANGTKTNIPWNGIFPEGQKPLTSLGIYRPDWAFKTTETMEAFYQKEQEFWTGKAGDPRKTGENGNWKGMAHYFTAKTVIQELPFITHFNTGSGKFFAVDGATQSKEEWNNRSLQDILPTWRWLKDSKGESLNVDFDWDTAFYGGSSLKISGNLTKKNATHVKLYKTNLQVEKDTEISLTYKTDVKKPNMKLGISFVDQPDDFVFFDVKKNSRDQWVEKAFNLNKYKGKKIAAISLFFESEEAIKDYQINIGEIKVTKKHKDNEVPAIPAKAKVKNPSFSEGLYADLDLSWKPVKGDIQHYEIYRNLPKGKKEFIGAVPNNAYYISNLRRSGKETATTLEIVAVTTDFVRGRAAKVMLKWPAYPRPKADFSVNQTVAAPGEEIQFFNHSSEATEEVEWQIEGGTPSISTENNPVVKYEEEGVYSVTLIAKNSEGENALTKAGFITISKDAKNLTNVALSKTATASGQCSPSEGPKYAMDGIVTNNSKWCAIGANHWLQVDLGKAYNLSKFVVKHAEAGGEPAAFNSRAFTIEVSHDGETWTNAVNATNNTDAISEHSIKTTEARYIRLSVQQPTQGGDQAIRIFEFEAYGY